MEAGETVLSLDLFDEELKLSVGSLGILLSLEISKRTLKDTSLQTLRGNFGSLCSVNQSLANLTVCEDGWSLNVIPVLPGERINDLLLNSLLASNFEARRELRRRSLIFFLTPFLPP